MKRIVTIVGARPQFIKAAAVSRALSSRPSVSETIVHTGQHYDDNMSEVFFREMDIPSPQHRLEVHGLSHGAMTGRMLEGLEGVLVQERPDAVLVYGDTTTTLAGALAAVKLHLPVVHVEAGLRSYNMRMPEEVNRILTDRVSRLLCCPTAIALENLVQEGFARFPCRLEVTGDVMQDAALYYGSQSALRSDLVRRLGLEGRPFAVCTVHRAENTDDPDRLGSIVSALDAFSRDMPVVAPLHPRTRAAMEHQGIGTAVTILEPVGYFDMLELVKRSCIVFTDSGGLQKEAFFFSRPCVILRDETEWQELVRGGYSRLAGAAGERILECARALLASRLDFSIDLYGGGHATERIGQLLERLDD